ncbi:MAG: TlpA disulfide reductase family protein, partial [Rhodospirillales bacterium]
TFTAADPPLPSPMVPFFDAGGFKHTLVDHRGRVVLVNFWTTWCPPCIREMALLDRLQAKLGGKDFEVLTISQDRGGVEIVKRFFRANNLGDLPIFIDRGSRLGGAFSQNLLPTSILLDKRGREVGRLVGGAEWDSEEAVALIKRYIN